MLERSRLFLNFVQGQFVDMASAFRSAMAARVVNKDLAHELRRHGKEVGSAPPLRQILLGQSQLRSVNQWRASPGGNHS